MWLWLVDWLEFNVPFQHKYGYIRSGYVNINQTSSSSSSQVFLKWPKQQRHHEDIHVLLLILPYHVTLIENVVICLWINMTLNSPSIQMMSLHRTWNSDSGMLYDHKYPCKRAYQNKNCDGDKWFIYLKYIMHPFNGLFSMTTWVSRHLERVNWSGF